MHTNKLLLHLRTRGIFSSVHHVTNISLQAGTAKNLKAGDTSADSSTERGAADSLPTLSPQELHDRTLELLNQVGHLFMLAECGCGCGCFWCGHCVCGSGRVHSLPLKLREKDKFDRRTMTVMSADFLYAVLQMLLQMQAIHDIALEGRTTRFVVSLDGPTEGAEGEGPSSPGEPG